MCDYDYLTKEFIKEAFDWAFLSDGLYSREVQEALAANFRKSYPDIFQEWREENKEYLTEEEVT